MGQLCPGFCDPWATRAGVAKKGVIHNTDACQGDITLSPLKSPRVNTEVCWASLEKLGMPRKTGRKSGKLRKTQKKNRENLGHFGETYYRAFSPTPLGMVIVFRESYSLSISYLLSYLSVGTTVNSRHLQVHKITWENSLKRGFV